MKFNLDAITCFLPERENTMVRREVTKGRWRESLLTASCLKSQEDEDLPREYISRLAQRKKLFW